MRGTLRPRHAPRPRIEHRAKGLDSGPHRSSRRSVVPTSSLWRRPGGAICARGLIPRFPNPNFRQGLAPLDRSRHGLAHQDEKPRPITRIGDAPLGNLLGASERQERRLQFRMGLDRVTNIGLCFPDSVSQLGALRKELNFLNNPATPMRLLLALAGDASVRIAFTGHDCDRLATRPTCSHLITSLGLSRCSAQRPLQILPPQHTLAPIRQDLDEERSRFMRPKLIGRAAEVIESTHRQLVLTCSIRVGPAARGTPMVWPARLGG